jgi:hypothetical protein
MTARSDTFSTIQASHCTRSSSFSSPGLTERDRSHHWQAPSTPCLCWPLRSAMLGFRDHTPGRPEQDRKSSISSSFPPSHALRSWPLAVLGTSLRTFTACCIVGLPTSERSSGSEINQPYLANHLSNCFQSLKMLQGSYARGKISHISATAPIDHWKGLTKHF